MVLLKNRENLLPLASGCRVALFGKGSFDYVKGGGGSGDVTAAYTQNVYDGLKGEGVSLYEPLSDFYRAYVAERYAAGDAPGLMAEPELPQALADGANKHADVAVIVLSRFSGEGWDRQPVLYQEPDYPWPDELAMPKKAMSIFPKGDFYLTDAEGRMVEQVCAAFSRVVLVLNTGGVMDVSWFWENDRISSVLLAYQAGMEGGAAVAALLTGSANPCGKLPDTFARDLTDYPSTAHFHDSPQYVEYTKDVYVGYRYFETLPGALKRVCYPFGYGLSLYHVPAGDCQRRGGKWPGERVRPGDQHRNAGGKRSGPALLPRPLGTAPEANASPGCFLQDRAALPRRKRNGPSDLPRLRYGQL